MVEEIAPNIRSFEVFLAVHRTGSFSLAGKLLGLAQPTITQRVQVLEQLVGARLFDRGLGEVRLTPAGVTLVSYAERIVAARDEMMQALNGLEKAPSGTLRIVASSTPGNYVMPVVLQGFHETFPGVRIQMSIGDSRNVVEWLFDGKAELGMVGDLPSDRRLVCVPFLDDEIVVIARPGSSALAHADQPMEIDELLRHAWILREPGSATRAALEGLLKSGGRGTGLNIAMEMDTTEAITLAVRVGAGIAVVSRRCVESELASGQLISRRIGKDGLRRQICAVRLAGKTLSAPAQQLWERLAGVRTEPSRDRRAPVAAGNL